MSMSDSFETPERRKTNCEVLWSEVYAQFVVKSSSLATKEADKAVKAFKERF